jgi:hypothetical protein
MAHTRPSWHDLNRQTILLLGREAALFPTVAANSEESSHRFWRTYSPSQLKNKGSSGNGLQDRRSCPLLIIIIY